MTARITWGLLALVCVAAIVPVALAGKQARRLSDEPGDAKKGKLVYIKFCGMCHALKAAGAKGTLGPDLDHDAVTYTRVVTSIEEGVGGIQAEYVLRNVTFSMVYDVSKYVMTARQKGGTRGEYS